MGSFVKLRGLAAIGCALALAFGLAGVPAYAEDLKAEKARLDTAVKDAKAAVGQATEELADAQERVARAEQQVSKAQGELQTAQSEVAAAEAIGVLRAAELEQANFELEEALAKEAEGQAKVDAQKDAVALYARSIYQDSLPLISVATLINVHSTASLANRIQWTDTVLTTNQVNLDYLRVIQAELAAARELSEAAQQRADEAKKAADEQIAVTRAAQQAAQAALDAYQAAMDEQVAAKVAAEQALQNNKANLAALEKERDVVNAKIAEAARKAAEEAAKGSGSVSSAGLIWPVRGPITSSYGYRVHPISGLWLFHDGVDLGVSCGTPIKAIASGRVTDEYYSSGYGYRIFVDHGYVNGRHIVSSSNHMQGYAVKNGATVAQGQTIGYIGTTGYSTGCHIHFMLWVDGKLVNPVNYLP
ncbi:MAG: peptidoglycan DD-metalloendopeptidase family protein [Propionibacteriaceae bacterium]|nr:peptidoglycan DD-metalloendopeptidase family protein [Propionibacteriaceae bacterium]